MTTRNYLHVLTVDKKPVGVYSKESIVDNEVANLENQLALTTQFEVLKFILDEDPIL